MTTPTDNFPVVVGKQDLRQHFQVELFGTSVIAFVT